MIQTIIKLTLCCLLLGGSALCASAQTGDFNPANPPDPQEIDYCKIVVSADPAEGAYVSGGGKYRMSSGGGSVYISASAKNTDDYTYTFSHWTLNGERYSASRSFYFTLRKGEMNFVAHFIKKEVVFDPVNPADPSGTNIKRKYKLYVTSNLENACSFNISSGDKHEEGSSFTLRVYPNAYYRFEGWRVNGNIVNTKTSFTYTMPSAETTIEAVFTELPYDPENPIDPPSSGGEQHEIDTRDPLRRLINLTIGNSTNSDVDRTRIVINDSKLLTYEAICDAEKFISNDAYYQMYSLDANGTKYQINERPLDNGIVPLAIIVNIVGDDVKITPSRLDCEDAILYDKVLNVKHQLAAGPYTFYSAAGTFENRFELRVPSAIIPGDVNGDGNVTIRDIVCLISYLNGGSLDGLNEKGADADGNGTINVYDVRAISNMLLGKK